VFLRSTKNLNEKVGQYCGEGGRMRRQCALKMHKKYNLQNISNKLKIYLCFFFCVLYYYSEKFIEMSFSLSFSYLCDCRKKGESHCLLNAYSYLLLNDLLKNHIFCVLCYCIHLFPHSLLHSAACLFYCYSFANALYTMVYR